jgi:hypothetical protein
MVVGMAVGMSLVQRKRGLKTYACDRNGGLCLENSRSGTSVCFFTTCKRMWAQVITLTDRRATLSLDVCPCYRNMFLVCSHVSCRPLQFEFACAPAIPLHDRRSCTLGGMALSCCIQCVVKVRFRFRFQDSESPIQVPGFD